MVSAIFSGLLSFLASVITVLLTPINLLLETIVPDLSSVVITISSFWDILSVYSKFVLSYTGMTSTTISAIVVLLIANIVIPWSVHGLKLIAKWWEVLI